MLEEAREQERKKETTSKLNQNILLLKGENNAPKH
jgi:hypothetical protein